MILNGRGYVVMSTNIPLDLADEIKKEGVKKCQTVTETIRQILLLWSAERRNAAQAERNLAKKKKSVLDDI